MRRRPDAARGEAGPRCQVAELTQIVDEDGYLASYETVTPDVYRVIEHVQHMVAGARRCAYEITARAGAESA